MCEREKVVCVCWDGGYGQSRQMRIKGERNEEVKIASSVFCKTKTNKPIVRGFQIGMSNFFNEYSSTFSCIEYFNKNETMKKEILAAIKFHGLNAIQLFFIFSTFQFELRFGCG